MRQIRMLRAMRRGLETDYGDFYTGTQGETPDTAKRLPTDRRASPRPYHDPRRFVRVRDLVVEGARVVFRSPSVTFL